MKFKIATKDGLKEVDGEPIDILGHKCFIHVFGAQHFITELSTGMKVCNDFSRDQTIEKAKELFKTHSEIEWKKSAMGSLKYVGIQFPVN